MMSHLHISSFAMATKVWDICPCSLVLEQAFNVLVVLKRVYFWKISAATWSSLKKEPSSLTKRPKYFIIQFIGCKPCLLSSPEITWSGIDPTFLFLTRQHESNRRSRLSPEAPTKCQGGHTLLCLDTFLGTDVGYPASASVVTITQTAITLTWSRRICYLLATNKIPDSWLTIPEEWWCFHIINWRWIRNEITLMLVQFQNDDEYFKSPKAG